MGLDRLAEAWFDTATATPGDADAAIGGELGGEHILAPLLTHRVPALTDQIGIASALARATDATLSVAVPGGTSPALRRRAPDDGELLDRALERASRTASGPGGGLTSGRRIVADVNGAVATTDADTVVLPGESPGGILRGDASERVAAHADCDAVVVNGEPGFGSVPSILLPIAGGPHSGLAADVAGRVARDAGAWIDVLHVVGEDATAERRERADACVEAAARRIGRPETTSTWVLEADDPTDAIVEQSRYYSLTVVGAPTRGRLRRLVYGSTTESVRSQARSVVLSVRNNTERRSLSDD